MAKDISKVANHVDDAIQNNRSKLDNIFSNLEETSENFNDFSQNLKFHPWKVLAKGKEASKEEMERDRAERRAKKAGSIPVETAATPTASEKPRTKQNFGASK